MLCRLLRCWPSIETVLAEFLVSVGVLASATCVPDAGVISHTHITHSQPPAKYNIGGYLQVGSSVEGPIGLFCET